MFFSCLKGTGTGAKAKAEPVKTQPKVPPERNLKKHKKYQQAYKRLDWFWGLGIEHETYFQTSQTKTFLLFDQTVMKPERYSVSYYKAYREDLLLPVLKKVLESQPEKKLHVPVLLNSHSFTHADKFGQHRTTYSKIPQPNPRFEGRIFQDWLFEHSDWFHSAYEKKYMWDGDTIEFMTTNFYKTSVPKVLAEIQQTEEECNKALAVLPRQGLLVAYAPLRLVAPINHPFATYHTNLNNIAMFNNGTIHLNITLPSRLGLWNPAEPLDFPSFTQRHKCLARLIQWLEPYWVAVYGAGDVLKGYGTGLGAGGSQRVGVGRYIGMGTFDTDEMPRGKINQIDRSSDKFPWYTWLYERCGYVAQEKIGLDLNFNKHGAHGLELRFFDQMSWDCVKRVLEQLVLLGDRVAPLGLVEKPQEDLGWQEAAGQALLEGRAWKVSVAYQNRLRRILGWLESVKEEKFVEEALEEIYQWLPRGQIWKLMGSE
jgi:hypothetical protein